MYRVVIDAIDNLTTLLGLTDRSYVDFYLKENKCTIVNSTVERFGLITLSAENYGDEPAVSFRVPRTLLMKAAVEGYLDFNFEDSFVSMTPVTLNKQKIFTTRFKKQGVFAKEYADALDIIKNLDKEYLFDASVLNKLVSITRSLNAILSVENRVAGIQVNNHLRVYQRVETDQKFSINVNNLYALTRISRQLYNIRNYLGAMNGSLIVLVKKCIGFQNDEFEFIEQQGAAYKCTLNLANVKFMLNKFKIDETVVSLDFVKKEVRVTCSRTDFIVPLVIEDEQIAPNYEIKSIDVPLSLFTGILSRMDDTLHFSKKKNFCRFEKDDIIVIF